jgi:hypothetical protein
VYLVRDVVPQWGATEVINITTEGVPPATSGYTFKLDANILKTFVSHFSFWLFMNWMNWT